MKRIDSATAEAIYEVGYNQFDRLYDMEGIWGDGTMDEWMYDNGVDPDGYYEIHTFGKYSKSSYEALVEDLADSAYMDPEFRIDKSHESTVEMSYFIISEAYGREEADRYLDEIMNLGYELNNDYKIPAVA